MYLPISFENLIVDGGRGRRCASGTEGKTSIQGIAIIDILGVGLIVLTVNLVRAKKLCVGYAAIWLLAVLGLMVIVSIPSLLYLAPRIVGAVFPASALSLFAFVFIFLVPIFFSVELSIISARQTEIIQSLTITELLAQEDDAGKNGEDDEL